MTEGSKNYEPTPEMERPQNLNNLEIKLFKDALTELEKNKKSDDELEKDKFETITVDHEGLTLHLEIVKDLTRKENGELEGTLLLQPSSEDGYRRAYVSVDIQNRNRVYTATSILARHGKDIISIYPSLQKIIENMLRKLANESRLPITHNATTRGVQKDIKLFNDLIASFQAHGYSKKREVAELWEEWEKIYTPQTHE